MHQLAVEWCELFAAEGFQVVRMDNRDVGLSSKLDGVEYTLADMADDVVAVLDARASSGPTSWACRSAG